MTPERLGQHFLADEGWRARILEQIAPAREQVWLEIGAGRGEMTRELAARAGRVVAIELDARLIGKLREATAGLNVEIVEGDVLTLDLAQIGGARFRVYGSLPYYISSPILRKLFACVDRIEEIDVVVQLEVAERLVARPRSRDYSWLSVLTQFYTRPEILLRIPPGAFRPAPKVDSALVRMTPPGERARLEIADETGFLEFASACFVQKRKTLVNNLKSRYGTEKPREALAGSRLSATVRAEELSVAQFAELYARLTG